MLFLYVVIGFLAHSANGNLTPLNISFNRYSLYNALATNCSSTNRIANYWWFNQRNFSVDLNGDPKWIPYMNSTKDLVVLLPALGENFFTYASTGQIKDAYFDYSGSVPEIIVVDYNAGLPSASLYSPPNGVCNYFDVSEKLAKFISNLNTSVGFQIEKMHLIGVSFGAHLAGITGYLLKSKYGYTLKRITGLDPLGAGYNCVICPSLRLSKGDAKFVDVILTNPGRIGVSKPLGDIDFYVNWPYLFSYFNYTTFSGSIDNGQLVSEVKKGSGFYGRLPNWIQPGCEGATDPDRCSVLRSASLFAESILLNDLRGSSCPNTPAQLPECIRTDYVYMGLYAPISSKYKVYYVNTSSQSPYGVRLPSGTITPPPITLSSPRFANFSQSSNQASLPEFRGSTMPATGKSSPEVTGRTMSRLRIRRRGSKTTVPVQSDTGRVRRRLF